MTNDQGGADEAEIRALLEELLESDIDITAREIARRHTRLAAASSITRSASRMALVKEYQAKQSKYREWAKRAAKSSPARLTEMLLQKDIKLRELEERVQLLTASHVAMIRAVGIVGGFPKWMELFGHYEKVRSSLTAMDALPPETKNFSGLK